MSLKQINKIRIIKFLVGSSLLFSNIACVFNKGEINKNFINEQEAELIAENYLSPIYGEDNIEDQKPFITRLVGEYWVIEGNFYEPPNNTGDSYFGGVFITIISRENGKVLGYSHSR